MRIDFFTNRTKSSFRNKILNRCYTTHLCRLIIQNKKLRIRASQTSRGPIELLVWYAKSSVREKSLFIHYRWSASVNSIHHPIVSVSKQRKPVTSEKLYFHLYCLKKSTGNQLHSNKYVQLKLWRDPIVPLKMLTEKTWINQAQRSCFVCIKREIKHF